MKFDRVLQSECDRVTTTTVTTSTSTTTRATTTPAPTTTPGPTSSTTTAAPGPTTTTPTPSAEVFLRIIYRYDGGTYEDSCSSHIWFGQQVQHGIAAYGVRSFEEVRDGVLRLFWNTEAREDQGLPCYFVETTLGDEMTEQEIVDSWPMFRIFLDDDGTYEIQ